MSSSPTRQKPRLPLWKRLLYSVIVVTTFLSVPEVILRWTDVDRTLFPEAFKDPYEVNKQGWWKLLTYDPVLYWKGRPFARLPGTDEFLNDRGFRGNSFRDEKPLGMQRIVCMGDSATFGLVHHGGINFTYTPTYSSELQRFLNRDKPVQDVEVINAGIIGYSSLQGLWLLKHHVRHWHPDVITIRYGVNDHLRLDGNYIPALEPQTSIVRGIQDTLLDTHTYQLLIRLKNSTQRTAAAAVPKASDAAPPAAGPVQVRVPVSDFEYNLRRLVIEGRATGAQVVLITAPLAPGFPEITSNVVSLRTMGYSSYEDLLAQHKRYEDAVRRVAADLHVDLLDGSRLLSERGLEKFFTHYDVAHPNGDGHTAIAEDLAALIQSKGLLSK